MTKNDERESIGMMTREEAMRRGFTIYDGGPCKRCGNFMRYVCNRGCVECNKESTRNATYNSMIARQHSKAARAAAAQAGAKQFEGAPCKKCNATLRYTSNGGCVACGVSAANILSKATRAKYHSTDALVIWVNEPPAESVAHLYQLIPFLASNPEGGNWSLRYTDAHHLAPGGMRLFTGRDVFERPQIMQMIRTDYTVKGYRGGHFDIVPHINEAMTQAIRMTNLQRSK